MPFSETITRLLTSGESSLGVALVGVAAGLKYVFPPFPSDMIVVTSVFLIARENTALAGAGMAVLFFSAVGFMIQYAAGRVIANQEEHWTTGWRGRIKPRIDIIIERFRRHGSLYVAINRFVPGLRAVMFLGAGMARLEPWKVLVFGTLGSAMWAAVLFAVGYFFGNQWDLIQRLFSTYGWYAAVGLVSAIAFVFGIRWLILRSRRRRVQ
jgi:membrane protein DedA with SNARE-associated domain